MPLFRRRAASAPPRARGGIEAGDRAALDAFVASRRGVEAYLEPATNVTPYTVVLVAHDGEWTRRPVGEPGDAAAYAKRARIPYYEVHATGYPPRMRAWTAARKRAGGDNRPTVGPAGAPSTPSRRPTDAELPPDPFA